MLGMGNMFQSPRSGKFVSDNNGVNMSVLSILSTVFQSPRSGKFVSDAIRRTIASVGYNPLAFQSPRSGKFVSDYSYRCYPQIYGKRFQSPRSGKFVSDGYQQQNYGQQQGGCFNPLDRGNLYQIFM